MHVPPLNIPDISFGVLLCSMNLSRAKRELSQLNQQTAPLLKLLCLRRVVLTATQTPTCTGQCTPPNR